MRIKGLAHFVTFVAKVFFLNISFNIWFNDNDNGDGNEMVNSKYNFALLQSFRDYFNLFNMTSGCGISLKARS